MKTTISTPVLLDFPKSSANVFLIMSLRDTEQNRTIHSTIKGVLSCYGVNLLRADDRAYSPDLWTNVKAYLEACEYAIAVFEQAGNDYFNPNVSLELGFMLAQQRHCLLLKEKTLNSLQSDLVGHLYKTFDADKIEETLTPQILQWLKDVGIAKAVGEKLLLYVSLAGTCRCAMAKVITLQSLLGRSLSFRLRIESVAFSSFGGRNVASKGARQAVYSKYAKDLLHNHVVTRMNPGLIEDADLILVMENSLKDRLPIEKTLSMKEFFGCDDIPNPWPDHADDASRKRYNDCLNLLLEAIEPNINTLINRLSPPEILSDRDVNPIHI